MIRLTYDRMRTIFQFIPALPRVFLRLCEKKSNVWFMNQVQIFSINCFIQFTEMGASWFSSANDSMIRSQQTSRLTGLEDYQWIMTLISLCFSQKVIAVHFYGAFASFKSLKLQCPFIYFQRMSKRYINESSLYVQKRRKILWMNKWQC